MNLDLKTQVEKRYQQLVDAVNSGKIDTSKNPNVGYAHQAAVAFENAVTSGNTAAATQAANDFFNTAQVALAGIDSAVDDALPAAGMNPLLIVVLGLLVLRRLSQ